MSKPRTIAVDFDGVIHSYTSPWISAEVIPDPPVPGALEWLHEVLQSFDVNVFTTRAETPEGRVAIKRWFQQHASERYETTSSTRGLDSLGVTFHKLPAIVFIDDRAYRFTGSNFPSVQELHDMKPWWFEQKRG